jgi:hypothetical protein
VLDLVALNRSFSADTDHPITGDLKGEVLLVRLELRCAVLRRNRRVQAGTCSHPWFVL